MANKFAKKRNLAKQTCWWLFAVRFGKIIRLYDKIYLVFRPVCPTLDISSQYLDHFVQCMRSSCFKDYHQTVRKE